MRLTDAATACAPAAWNWIWAGFGIAAFHLALTVPGPGRVPPGRMVSWLVAGIAMVVLVVAAIHLTWQWCGRRRRPGLGLDTDEGGNRRHERPAN